MATVTPKQKIIFNHFDEPIGTDQLKRDPVLNWEVHTAPSYYKYDGELYENKDKLTLVRSDDPSVVLGSQVGSSYNILQNSEMIDWLDTYLTRDYLKVTGYGYFGRGTRVFVQCFNDFASKVNNDDIRGYFLIQNAHGGGAIKLSFCTIRVICQNTLSMAAQLGTTIRIQHNANMRLDLQAVHHQLNLAKKVFEDENELFRALERKPMQRHEFQETLEKQFSKELSNRNDKDPATYPIIKASLDNWDSLPDLRNIDNTAWKGFNALNYNFNHGYGSVKEESAKVRLFDTGTYMSKINEFKKLALV